MAESKGDRLQSTRARATNDFATKCAREGPPGSDYYAAAQASVTNPWRLRPAVELKDAVHHPGRESAEIHGRRRAMRPARGNVTGLNWCSTVGFLYPTFFALPAGTSAIGCYANGTPSQVFWRV